jgi:uncharacterized protein YjeT (DUF2065 family)
MSTVTVTVFLTSEDHNRRYHTIKSEADAISRIRTATVATFELSAELTLRPLGHTLEEIFAITNDAPGLTPSQLRAAQEYRYGDCIRSVSVGDTIHVEGLGIFGVNPTGWKRLTHRLTAMSAARALARATGQPTEQLDAYLSRLLREDGPTDD